MKLDIFYSKNFKHNTEMTKWQLNKDIHLVVIFNFYNEKKFIVKRLIKDVKHCKPHQISITLNQILWS